MNKLESSTIHTYLNSTFLNLFDSNVRNAIKQVKIPYRKDGGGNGSTNQSGANGLPCKISLLSGYEVGWMSGYISYLPLDGAKLDYFEDGTGLSAGHKRIANLNGSAVGWWLRSPYTGNTDTVFDVNSNGGNHNNFASASYGIRPALILRSYALVDDEFNIIS